VSGSKSGSPPAHPPSAVTRRLATKSDSDDARRRLCLVGKHPPIQGGVSAQTYVAAQTLSSRGCQVDVVTNARDVEPEFRQLMQSADEERLSTAPAPGNVRIHFTSELPEGDYIPWADPYVSKLLGLTLSVIEEADSEALVGWYLEPYGLVAALAAKLTGRPVMLIHAGSDIGRLAQHPNLVDAYRWSISSSDRIPTHPVLIPRLVRLGARPEQFVFPGASRLPDFFWQPASPLDVQEYWPLAVERYRQLADQGAISPPSLEPSSFDSQAPTIGVYGKVGDVKGSFDLLAALSRLAGDGLRFNLLAAVGGHRQDYEPFLERVWSDRGLRERAIVLPFLPPWRIPELLARCDIACCLERRFPITFHTSRVPLEIATAGVCPVCSSEVIEPHAGDGAFAHDQTCVEVKDPEDHDELVRALRWAVENRSHAQAIGARARSTELVLQDRYPSESSVADAVESWLVAHVQPRP
jgi:glycosyltransferase involved in cell wall biosynthesis